MRKHILISASIIMFSVQAFALEPLSDKALAQTTAQDGLTIGIKNTAGIGLKHLRLIQEGNDFTVGGIQYNQAAGISINMPNNKIMFCAGQVAAANCAVSNDPMTIELDTDGGTTGGNDAYINATIQTQSKSIYIPIKTISLLGGMGRDALGHTTWTKEVPLVEFSDGIKIEGKSGITANLQLGNQPQGNMVLVSIADEDGSNINLGKVKLLSQNTNVGNSQISTDIAVTGFSKTLGTKKASGTTVNIDTNEGLVIAKKSATIETISINNTVLGAAGQNNTSVFQGLDNAAIGNFSIENIKINNLKIGVAGM